MLSAQQQALTQQDEFAPLAAAAQNMKGKKLNKAIENYAWNIRMLKGQADLIAQAHQQAGMGDVVGDHTLGVGHQGVPFVGGSVQGAAG